jgi:hypothetical protein
MAGQCMEVLIAIPGRPNDDTLEKTTTATRVLSIHRLEMDRGTNAPTISIWPGMLPCLARAYEVTGKEEYTKNLAKDHFDAMYAQAYDSDMEVLWSISEDNVSEKIQTKSAPVRSARPHWRLI